MPSQPPRSTRARRPARSVLPLVTRGRCLRSRLAGAVQSPRAPTRAVLTCVATRAETRPSDRSMSSSKRSSPRTSRAAPTPSGPQAANASTATAVTGPDGSASPGPPHGSEVTRWTRRRGAGSRPLQLSVRPGDLPHRDRQGRGGRHGAGRSGRSGGESAETCSLWETVIAIGRRSTCRPTPPPTACCSRSSSGPGRSSRPRTAPSGRPDGAVDGRGGCLWCPSLRVHGSERTGPLTPGCCDVGRVGSRPIELPREAVPEGGGPPEGLPRAGRLTGWQGAGTAPARRRDGNRGAARAPELNRPTSAHSPRTRR